MVGLGGIGDRYADNEVLSYSCHKTLCDNEMVFSSFLEPTSKANLEHNVFTLVYHFEVIICVLLNKSIILIGYFVQLSLSLREMPSFGQSFGSELEFLLGK